MPNHITNIITIKGTKENVDKVLKFVKSEDRDFDFEKIKPSPKEMLRGALSQEDREKYPLNWYDWNLENWGTKWNAYDVKIDDNKIYFDTAWSTPEPIILKMQEMFQEVDIECIFADEDRGYNVGEYQLFKNDDGTKFLRTNYFENASNKAYETYIQCKGKSSCLYQNEDGDWKSYDCDNCPNVEEC